MARVKRLSSEVRDKIAAGEVILRPVSVVKELIENSIDARAKRIEIEITNGGKTKILVNDDGIGMNREDAVLSVERYTTSKIEGIDDIERIKTLGFRGEALASIASVSRFELETSDGEIGTRLEVDAGRVIGIFESQRPRGTRIKVMNLFYNLPARLKFLKSDEWELRLIADTVKSYVLINPMINFHLSSRSRVLINTSATDDYKKRIRQIFPRSLVEHLIDFTETVGSIKISGFISEPGFFEKSKLKFIYVNSRPVRYPRIFRTIRDAFDNPMVSPSFFICITVPPEFIDVNIHPAKEEIKFKDERYIMDLLGQILKKKFTRHSIKVSESPVEFVTSDFAEKSRGFIQESMISNQISQPVRSFDDASEFWQLHNTYIFAQTKSGFVIIDQHVAHERILYEAIMKGKGQSQRLLFPITLELSLEEYRVYKKTRKFLKELGLDFKEFSSRTIVIDALPGDFQVNRQEIVDIFRELDGLGNLIKEKAEIAKVVACKGAIKAGQKLKPLEMMNLIDQLFACENPYTCPHGRPIILKFTLDELGHRFGRI